MKILVIDTETTGLGDDAQVVEFAYTTLYSASVSDTELLGDPMHERVVHEPRDDRDFEFFIGQTTSALVKPTVPISFEAMAVHHITNEALDGCMSWDDVRDWSIAPHMLDDVAAFAAHNADYDKRFFPDLVDSTGRVVPWVCTYRCAYAMIPDAPSHKNGVLRYFLDLPVIDHRTQPSHRAGPDTYVTAHILAHLFAYATLDELIDVSSRPRDLRKLGFGKHGDEPIGDVPNEYLRWMAKQGLDSFDVDVAYTVRQEMERRNEAWRRRQAERINASSAVRLHNAAP